ncbi:MAG: NAD(P)H-dependent oxidoreductase subunit E [Candidatus Moranbacteria bacterium]|nr:NAD(P)H-dependent oxidoreductase subunit E [Candidatus Moranbacteria bacterium]
MQKSSTTSKILLDFDPEAANLLPALKKINVAFRYISEVDAEKVAEYFELPLAKVYETASFYDLLETKKPAILEIEVCSGGDCTLGESAGIIKEIENRYRIKTGDEFNPKVRLKKISCLGRCSEGPIMIVNGKVYEKMTASGVHKILGEWG